ncbi:hypothetical protein [Crenothrix sp.]|uniref:hypothetical protein n=1 Tax=Crenothrix sp. TaxID=3100433 RepID=UPI00374DF8F2
MKEFIGGTLIVIALLFFALSIIGIFVPRKLTFFVSKTENPPSRFKIFVTYIFLSVVFFAVAGSILPQPDKIDQTPASVQQSVAAETKQPESKKIEVTQASLPPQTSSQAEIQQTEKYMLPKLTKEEASRCDLAPCPAGTHVVSYFKKNDPYVACPTKELAEYTNFAIGLMVMTLNVSGGDRMPNISPITGDPEYEGSTKIMMDNLRDSAGVKTFDQAMTVCRDGKNGRHLVVMNNRENESMI